MKMTASTRSNSASEKAGLARRPGDEPRFIKVTAIGRKRPEVYSAFYAGAVDRPEVFAFNLSTT